MPLHWHQVICVTSTRTSDSHLRVMLYGYIINKTVVRAKTEEVLLFVSAPPTMSVCVCTTEHKW